MVKEYTTPAGTVPAIYSDMARQTHLLIAGATGSGKSVVINGIIHSLLFHSPASVELILIDVKRVELCDYKRLPHCIEYADDVTGAVHALNHALQIIETRFRMMQSRRIKKYAGGHVYVIIDELADLMTIAKKDVVPLLQRICQIGRAANVHVIAATQCPIAAVIPTQIKVNFDSRVGLRTRSAQDSRNILGVKGCELLPRYGLGYYMKPESCNLYKLPMIEESETRRLVSYWTGKTGKPKYKLFA